ncbi:hypothetical protein C6P40_004485, partial [Pichia californica]
MTEEKFSEKETSSNLSNNKLVTVFSNTFKSTKSQTSEDEEISNILKEDPETLAENLKLNKK